MEPFSYKLLRLFSIFILGPFIKHYLGWLAKQGVSLLQKYFVDLNFKLSRQLMNRPLCDHSA